MKRLWLISLIVVYAVFPTVFCDDVNEGNSELLIPYDGVVLSMAGGSLNAPDLSNLFINPSFITYLSNRIVARGSYYSGNFPGSTIGGLSAGGRIASDLFAYLEFSSYDNPDYIMTDETGLIIRDDPMRFGGNSSFKLGLGYQFFGRLSVGFNMKFYSVFIPDLNGDTESKTFTYPSLGFSYSTGKLTLGLAINDFARFYDEKDDDDYPTLSTLNLSGGISLLDDKLTVNVSNSMKLFRDHYNVSGAIGVQYTLAQLLSLRAAYTGLNPLSSGIHLGIGLQYSSIQFDYDITFGELGTYHYLSLGYGMMAEERVIKASSKKKKRPKNKPSIPAPPEEGFEKVLVAVLDFEGKNIASQDAAIITDFIRQSLLSSGYFKVLERGMINELLNEVNLQQSGCTSSECAVKIGKILAVKKMIVGNVSKLGKKFFINLRMVDVETSQIDFATSVGADVPIEELPGYVSELVQKVVDALK